MRDSADFYIWPRRIVCYVQKEAREHLVETQFLVSVLSFWLEREGCPVIHASSVVLGQRAIAFQAGSGGGKSWMAAAFMQAGGALLTDDILPVQFRRHEFLGRPGWPQISLWPEDAESLLPNLDSIGDTWPGSSKRRVPVGHGGFGRFCERPRPLARVYVLDRRKPQSRRKDICITPLSPKEAVIEMVRYSFAPHIVEAMGLQPRRLWLFARMAEQLPIRRLTYPSGFRNVSRIREAVLADLDGLP